MAGGVNAWKMKETASAFIAIRESDILYVKMKDLGEEMQLPQYLELLNDCIELMGQRRHFLLLDLRNIHVNFGHEVRSRKASHPYVTTHRIAEAFLINSLPMRLVSNVYLAVNKPKVPTRFFSEESDALKWIAKQRSDNESGYNKTNPEAPVFVNF